PESTPSAVLAHRYSFEIDATDSVGSADFGMVGNAAVSNGSLFLPGGGKQRDYAATTGNQLIELAETLNQSYAVTMEFWFQQRFARNWAKLFMAGRGFDGSYLSVTPRRQTGAQLNDM